MRRRRSLAELLERAHEELRTNPTITVTTFRNGAWHTRPAYPPARISAMFRNLGQAFVEIKPVFDDFAKAMAKLTAKLREIEA